MTEIILLTDFCYTVLLDRPLGQSLFVSGKLVGRNSISVGWCRNRAIERENNFCYNISEEMEQVMYMELPKRKQNRLTGYNYSTPNAYFITICTRNRKNLLWKDVGAIIDRPENVPLTNLGVIVRQSINDRPYNINGGQVNEGSGIQTSRIPCLAKRLLRSCD